MKCKTCGGNRTKDQCKICELLASGRPPGGHHSAHFPRAVSSLGLHPSQVEEAQTASVRLGVPTEYNKAGDPIIRDQRHYKNFCEKVRGAFNLDGCPYTDASPTGVKYEGSPVQGSSVGEATNG